MRFNELRKVLEAYGYKMHQLKGGSSRYISERGMQTSYNSKA